MILKQMNITAFLLNFFLLLNKQLGVNNIKAAGGNKKSIT